MPVLALPERRISRLPAYIPGLIFVTLLVGAFLGRQLWNERADSNASLAELVAQADAQLIEGLRTDATATYDEASRQYLLILASDPEYPEAVRGAAIADLGLHRFSLALQRATLATKLRPDDHIAVAALVDADIELGRYEEAEAALDRLLSMRPGLASYSRLSYFRQLTGDDEGALEAMFLARSAAAGLRPEVARVDELLGEIYFSQGDLENAMYFYTEAAAANPGRLKARAGIARIHYLRGDLDAARKGIEDILETDAGAVGALMLQAEMARVAGDDALADAAVDAVVSVAFAEHDAGFGLDPSTGLFASTWGEPSAGLELAEIVYRARPQNIKAAHAYAWALHRVGRSDEAVHPLEQALRFDTTDPDLSEHAEQILAASR